jgi:hypothetical protein
MAENARACRICEKRRPRRYCPGVEGDICPICCGTGREVTVNCPLDCVFLQDARKHERLPEVDPRQFPNVDIKVDDEFLRRNEALLILLASTLASVSLKTAGAVDNDVKQALDSLVRTYRTLQSGLVYEVRPDNVLAKTIHTEMQEAVRVLRERLESGNAALRDADVLGILAFLQRLEIQHNNQRPKGRAFIDFLRSFFPPTPFEKERVSGAERPGLIITP